MSFLIDTDICSAYLKSGGQLASRFIQHSGHLHLSVITLGELYTWALRKNASPKYLEALMAFLSDVTVLDVTQDVAQTFGTIRAQLFDQGTTISGMDLMIAATALIRESTLVTHNTKHFNKNSRIESGRLAGGVKNIIMKFELEPYHRNVPDEEFLKDLKHVSEEIGKQSVTMDEYNEIGRFHSSTLSHRFGSWFAALEKAGLKKTRNLHISKEDLLSNLVEVWTKLGRQPKYNELTRRISKYSTGTYDRRFGSWRKALESFIVYVNSESKDGLEEIQNDKLCKSNRQKSPRTISLRMRFLVMRRDDFKCCLCGNSPALKPGLVLHVDHIIPWSEGGETVLGNLQTLCEKCNIGKSNLPIFTNGTQ